MRFAGVGHSPQQPMNLVPGFTKLCRDLRPYFSAQPRISRHNIGPMTHPSLPPVFVVSLQLVSRSTKPSASAALQSLLSKAANESTDGSDSRAARAHAS